jgi:RNA polymerase sigma-70 factor (ECF subfamily)
MSKIAIRYYDNNDDAVASINLAFLKLLQNLQQYDASYSLSTYLRKILVNTILNDIKAKTKYSLLFLEDDANDYAYDFSVNDSEHQLAYADVLKLIYCLPPVHRSTFNLYVVDGYSHKEVGDMLNISETHSKWLVHDARKRLIKMLNEMNQTVMNLKKVL